jgi:hypothetical protein
MTKLKTCETCKGSGIVDSEHCTLCGKAYDQQDIDGGRCLKCLHMICASTNPNGDQCEACGGSGEQQYIIVPV